ncbi:MAG: hypothetical protein WDW38_008048 [Sanguina aurantia]
MLLLVQDNFTNLIKAARIPEDYAVTETAHSKDRIAPGDLLEVWAEKLAFAGYMALHHVAELKKGVALCEPLPLSNRARVVRNGVDTASDAVDTALGKMREEVGELLGRCEGEYYASSNKGAVVHGAVSEELQALCQLTMESWKGGQQQGQ